jgi:hypothetical protein
LKSEVLYLKDGSTLKGRLVKVDQDTLYFETLFGSAFRIHREKVSRVDFVEGLIPASPGIDSQVHVDEEPGTLHVSFEKFTLTSRIVVERDREREAHEQENAIEQVLLVDGKQVYSMIDSTTDKVVRMGPETVLRNDVQPVDFKIALAPGLYDCAVVLANSRASVYVKQFDPAPLDRKLILDNVDVRPGEATHVRIGLKRKSWRSGKSELYKTN